MIELEKKYEKYLKMTEKALKKIKINEKLNKEYNKAGNDFLDMAKRYYEDSIYFKKKNDLINAFAAINYSHAFLDAGARLKVFKVKDSKLFMVD